MKRELPPAGRSARGRVGRADAGNHYLGRVRGLSGGAGSQGDALERLGVEARQAEVLAQRAGQVDRAVLWRCFIARPLVHREQPH